MEQLSNGCDLPFGNIIGIEIAVSLFLTGVQETTINKIRVKRDDGVFIKLVFYGLLPCYNFY
jgi:hypothetical protein